MTHQSIISLDDILALVGKLDDTPGLDAPRERFRNHLQKIVEVGQLRDYVETCLRASGEQYARALQDLVNYAGNFFGFHVTYGRYQGISGEHNFDGRWEAPGGLHIVIETKTTEIYPIKTSKLLNYINELVAAGQIPKQEDALGLYVVGHPDPEIQQLENAIVVQKPIPNLRIVSALSLLSLAEMRQAYGLNDDDVLSILLPSGPRIDPLIMLIDRLVAEREAEATMASEQKVIRTTVEKLGLPEPTLQASKFVIPDTGTITFWITPVRDDEGETAEQTIQRLVGEEHIYAFGEKTPGRRKIKSGDVICFYAAGRGVIADARVTSPPIKRPHPRVKQPDKYPWVFRIKDTHLYLENPVVIDGALRSQLDRFQGRDPNGPWAWFVQATHDVSQHDFELLTRQKG